MYVSSQKRNWYVGLKHPADVSLTGESPTINQKLKIAATKGISSGAKDGGVILQNAVPRPSDKREVNLGDGGGSSLQWNVMFFGETQWFIKTLSKSLACLPAKAAPTKKGTMCKDVKLASGESICESMDNAVWHSSITVTKGGCAFHATTGGTTNCNDWCQKHGLVCTHAQDNKGGCALDKNHHRKDMSNNGCNQKWGDQVCACGAKAKATKSCTAFSCSTASGPGCKTCKPQAERQPTTSVHLATLAIVYLGQLVSHFLAALGAAPDASLAKPKTRGRPTTTVKSATLATL